MGRYLIHTRFVSVIIIRLNILNNDRFYTRDGNIYLKYRMAILYGYSRQITLFDNIKTGMV